MSKIALIKDDNLLGIDGVFRTVDLSALVPSAVHFDTVSSIGEEEFEGFKNTKITSISKYQHYITEWANAGTPEVPIETTPIVAMSSLEFLERFTVAEQLAVVGATLVSPDIKLWYDKMLAASYIDLNDPRVDEGLSALVTAGLLASQRKIEILTA